MAMDVDPDGDGCPDLQIASCLDCPLPACRFDLPEKAAVIMMRAHRFAAVLDADLTNDAAARALGVSVRTVIRYRNRRRTAHRSAPSPIIGLRVSPG